MAVYLPNGWVNDKQLHSFCYTLRSGIGIKPYLSSPSYSKVGSM